MIVAILRNMQQLLIILNGSVPAPDCVIPANQSLPCAVSNGTDNDKGNLPSAVGLIPPAPTLSSIAEEKWPIKSLTPGWSPALVYTAVHWSGHGYGLHKELADVWAGGPVAILFMGGGANLFAKPLLNEAAGKSQKGISCNQ